jgi:tetratricopeptide (TPR) repeat protein
MPASDDRFKSPRYPRVMACYTQGEAARVSGRPDEAVAWYAQALLLDAGHRPSLLSLAAALTALGREEEAQRALQRADQRLPEDPATGFPRNPAIDGGAAGLVPRRPQAAAPGATQELIVPAPPAEPQRSDLYKRAMLLGGITFPAVLATYVMVGLATHFAPGLGAAALAALLLAAFGSLFFPANRKVAFKGILHGMLWGVGLVLLAGFASIIIAVGRALAA